MPSFSVLSAFGGDNYVVREWSIGNCGIGPTPACQWPVWSTSKFLHALAGNAGDYRKNCLDSPKPPISIILCRLFLRNGFSSTFLVFALLATALPAIRVS